MFNDIKFFLLGVGNKNTTGTAKLEFTRKKFPLLSMLNQHFSKYYTEAIGSPILMKLILLDLEILK